MYQKIRILYRENRKRRRKEKQKEKTEREERSFSSIEKKEYGFSL